MKLKKIPAVQLDIRQRTGSDGEAITAALTDAVETARSRGYAAKFATIEPVLDVGELWADRAALRALLIGEKIPPIGTEYALAVVPAEGLIEPRWYVLPPARTGVTPLRLVVIAVDAGHYATLAGQGWEGLFEQMIDDLEQAGAVE